MAAIKSKAPKNVLLTVLLCAFLLTSAGCEDGSHTPSVSDSSILSGSVTVDTVESEPTMVTDVISDTTSGTSDESSPQDNTPDVTTETTEREDTVPSEGFSEEVPPTEVTTEPIQSTQSLITTSIVESAVTSTESDVVTSVATTTVVTEPPEPVVPVVIPEVYTVSSPETMAVSNEKALIDYSHSDRGYIGAKYFGSSDRAKLRIVCGGVTYDHDLSIGGVVEYFPLSQGSGDYHIAVYEHLDGKNYGNAIEVKEFFNISDEVDMYLYPNKYVSFVKSSDCVYKAAEVCAGLNGTVERLAAIFEYITDNITYDHELASTVKSGYVPYPDNTLFKKKGICFDYASLVAAMARSQSIPTRLVIGYASPDIYHAWNEVYTDETGWISAELLLSQKGYNIVDATFYAGTVDKEAIAKYISDSSNYAAIYRY